MKRNIIEFLRTVCVDRFNLDLKYIKCYLTNFLKVYKYFVLLIIKNIKRYMSYKFGNLTENVRILQVISFTLLKLLSVFVIKKTIFMKKDCFINF